MTERRIAFLDGCRGLAAAYVALSHVIRHHFTGSAWWAVWPWVFAQEAVILFFLLSGYVIQWSVENNRQLRMGEFLWRRFLRLYPLFALALIVSYATDSLAVGNLQPVHWKQALANLLALQDFAAVKPGVIANVYGGNAPLWSLSYECWFYVFFAVLHWKVRRFANTGAIGCVCLIGAIAIVCTPNAAAYWVAYFMLWWTGRTWAVVEADPAKKRIIRKQAVKWLAAVTGIVVIGTACRVGVLNQPWRMGTYPVLVARHFGFGTVLAFIGLIGSRRLIEKARVAFESFAWLGEWSYGLYVLHFPLAAGSNWLRRPFSPMAAFLVYGSIACVASWFAETQYQRYVRRWLDAARKRYAGRLCRAET
jgi:peptidoglycan/LPS O-acetylase OafA/YrhL